MISIIRAPANAEDQALLRQLFAVRYELFVEGRGWHNLARPDRLDIDQYDDESTTYFINLMHGKIVGGARIRPSLQPHMLQEMFGSICEGNNPPSGPTIYECSRTFVARRHPDRRTIFAELLLSVAQHCVTIGIDQLTGILEPWWLNSYLALGLVADPLGMPQDVEGMLLLPVSFKIDAGVCDTLQSRLTEIKLRKISPHAA